MSYQNSQNIQVAVRCRPLNEREVKQNSVSVIECNEKRREINVFDKNAPVPTTKTFTFDKVFGVNSKQSEVYDQVVKPVVLEVIEGYNCTIFAYGQTGTGKTFTMEGNSASLLSNDSVGWESDPLTGIIPRSVAHLFTILNSLSNCEYSVKISFIELYNEELSDLLSDSTDKLRIYEDSNRKGSVVIPGLEEVVVNSKNEVYKILQKGAEKRQKASTLMNSQSSRSHSIFTITSLIREKSLDGEEIIKVGKLNLVDLAGSENIERSGATGKRAAEAGKINKSLTTLGRVITALVEHRDHIPYRESNLTRLLQDSLGGKTKTTIIATISPAQCNFEETISTLDYAHKAKSIRNKPELNQKLVKKTLIKEYNEEIDKLKRELIATREKNGVFLPVDIHDGMVAKIDEQKEEIRDLSNKINSLNEDIEKLNEQFKETKQNLDEKCQQLNSTHKQLVQTESNLQAAKQECEESKFVIEERIKTETQLLLQAQELQTINKQADLDCHQLHQKITRINDVHQRNKSLICLFSQKMTEKLKEILLKETESTKDHKENLCGLCDQLTDIETKLNGMKSDILCELHLYDEHHNEWLNDLSLKLNSEIEANCSQFYKIFLDLIQSSNEFNKTQTSSQLTICLHHNELFQSTWSEIKRLVDKIETNSNEFNDLFDKKTNEYLVNNKQEIQTTTNEYVSHLNKLSVSISSVQEDVTALKTSQNELQSSVIETLDSLQSTIQQLSNKFKQSVQQLEAKCQEIAFKNTTNLTELTQIKESFKLKEQQLVLNRTNEFNDLIVQPVKQLLQINGSDLNGLNLATKQLNENQLLFNDKLNKTISETSLKHKETNDSLKQMVDERISNLNEMNKQVQENIVGEKEYSDDFYVRFNRDNVGAECESITNLIKKSLEVTEMTQFSVENLSQTTKQFYSESIDSLDCLVRKEFQDDKPNGNSPSVKVYYNQIEFARTKRNTLLIEEFKAKKQLEMDANLLKVPMETNSSRPSSPEMFNEQSKVDPLVVVPVKRTASEKENSDNKTHVDKNGKNNIKMNNPTKMRKLNNPALIDKN